MTNFFQDWLRRRRDHPAVVAFRHLEEANPELRDKKLGWRLLLVLPNEADEEEQKARLFNALGRRRIRSPYPLTIARAAGTDSYYFACWSPPVRNAPPCSLKEEVIF